MRSELERPCKQLGIPYGCNKASCFMQGETAERLSAAYRAARAARHGRARQSLVLTLTLAH